MWFCFTLFHDYITRLLLVRILFIILVKETNKHHYMNINLIPEIYRENMCVYVCECFSWQ